MGLALLVLGCHDASGAAARHSPSFAESAKFFVNQWHGETGYPLLFVGKVIKADSGNLPCTIQNSRRVTWSVSKVLVGFDPGDEIQLWHGSCGRLEPEFPRGTEMLVLAVAGHGQKELVVPATEDNVRQARKILDTYLRERIKKFVAAHRVGRKISFLVFEGTLVDPGPRHDDTSPCLINGVPSFNTKFDVEQVLQGEWADEHPTIRFRGCDPLSYQRGQRMVVFADVYDRPQPGWLYGRFLVPPDQRPQVKAALDAALKK
jgi:hypothetical protein